MNLVVPVREYVSSLVHASARHDPLMAARHRAFMAPRLLGGLLALAALPPYLALRGAPGPLEIAAFAWLLAPIAIAYFLAFTGRYSCAHLLSALALTAAVFNLALMSGGLFSPVVSWLALAPLEAALATSRRVVLAAMAMAFAAVLALALLGGGFPTEETAPMLFTGACSIAGAVAYAGFLALRVEAFARGSDARLDAEEQRYRLLAHNMTDVISRHGNRGAVLFISPAAEAMFGAPLDELKGHGLFDRVHIADRPIYLSALADASAGVAERSVEFRVRCNGAIGDPGEAPRFIWVEMRCQPLGTEAASGEGREVVAVMRDVTRRKDQERAVEEARREAERANAAKGRFLATMSHELRTPLNAVIGFSELLMSESSLQLDAARRREYAKLIHESGQHLLSVVNLVLDLSKIESGKFVITPEPFAPAPVIRSCCDLLSLKIREADLDLVLRVPDALPEIVADKRALKQILLNLLSNAVKFTAAGGTISVAARVVESWLEIVVEDTGVGIAPEDMQQIGSPFFQVRGAYDRPCDGTGLGLSIVKGLASLHGGALEIDSEPGIGTRVTVRLPLDCEKAASPASGDVVRLNADGRREVAEEGAPTSRSEQQVKKRA